MISLTRFRTARLIAVIAAAVLLGAGFLLFSTTRSDPQPPQIAAASAPTAVASVPTVKTIEYDGVRVDVPVAWQRLDMSDCEFQFVRWAPPAWPACDFANGLSFYRSATFDPAHGPGVQRDGATWAGYVYAGDYAVYMSGAEPTFVQSVLDTARPV